jgi:hypothetical protein
MDTDAIPFPVITSSVESQEPLLDTFADQTSTEQIRQRLQSQAVKSNSLIALEQLAKKRKNSTIRKPKQKWNWATSTNPDPSIIPEQFVPTREPETRSEREKKQIKRDTAWCIEYLVELGMIFFGFCVAYYTYYYITVVPDPKATYQTGVPFIDSLGKHLVAPLAQVRSWLTSTNLPAVVVKNISLYPALFVLLTALSAVIFLLWNKNGFIEMATNATKMQASPLAHVLIALSWSSSIFAFTFGNMATWMFNPVGTLIFSIFIIVFSHVMAGITQLGLFGLFAYLFTGLDKFITTNSPSVTIPDPETPEEFRKRIYESCMENATKNAQKMGGALSIPVSDPLPVATFGERSDSPDAEHHNRAVCQSQDNLNSTKQPFWSKINSVAFTILPFIREIILICFAVVKLVNGAMQTLGGRLFSYGMNGAIIFGAIAVIAMNMSPTPKDHHIIRVTD